MWVELLRAGNIQRLAYDDFEQRVKAGEVGPEVPLRFRPVTGEGFVPAGELALFRTLADPAGLAFRRRLSSAGLPIVTAALAGIQLRLYLSTFDGEAADWYSAHLVNWGPGVVEGGEIWRLLSYGMLHFTAPHILLNLCFLVYAAWNLERALGRVNVLLLYFGAVVSGGLLSMLMMPARQSVGASGGAFGLLAASIALGWKRWDDLPAPARKSFGWALVPYVVLSLVSGMQSEDVDNWCHLGGLIGGLVMMTVLDADLRPERRRRNALAQVGVGLSILLGLLTPWALGTRLVPLVKGGEGLLQSPHPETWVTGWTLTGDRGFRSPLGLASVAAVSTEHDDQISALAALAPIRARLEAAGPVTAIEVDPVKRDGWSGVALHVRFEREGRPTVAEIELYTRGVYEVSLQFVCDADQVARYEPLRQRIFAQTTLAEPPELAAAEAAVAANPRSWQPLGELGRVRFRVGDLAGAADAYAQAQALAPAEPALVEGALTVAAHGDDAAAVAAAREALARFPDRPSVILAAVTALEGGEAPEEAVAALDAAWARLPGDRSLRRARLRRGLSVELP